ncbi:hypothetical protein [Candidatus Nitrosocosmicus franklandus]|uniref:Uncharacterized protein n=1 Tax=Candidatus Nitrosocosmicus franklandianus TaxID=1798806 RepID=A0A484I970_9ARCH|nr:hypothetical protein [Candidatus Nitrosocosmicus franklandus]VFJ12796.1 exported protein of unknown function [Candidatus Nitrosocosmicus franklandus]
MKNACFSIFVILLVALFTVTFNSNLKSVWAEGVIDTIEVGIEPEAVAYNLLNKNIYM